MYYLYRPSYIKPGYVKIESVQKAIHIFIAADVIHDNKNIKVRN